MESELKKWIQNDIEVSVLEVWAYAVNKDTVNISGGKQGFRKMLNSILDKNFLFLWDS